ncbi:hypothetical protein D3C86_1502870 [compost metagenome]
MASQNGDVQTVFAQGRSRLQGNETVADDHRSLARLRSGQNPLRLILRAQHEDLRQVGTGQRERVGRTAGGEQRGVIRQRLTVSQSQGFIHRIQTGHFTLYSLDSLLVVEAFIAQRWDFLRRHFTGDHEFAQHRAVVAGVGFAVDQQHAAAKAFFAQRRRSRRSRGTGTDDHERALIVSRRCAASRQGPVVDPNLVVAQF